MFEFCRESECGVDVEIGWVLRDRKGWCVSDSVSVMTILMIGMLAMAVFPGIAYSRGVFGDVRANHALTPIPPESSPISLSRRPARPGSLEGCIIPFLGECYVGVFPGWGELEDEVSGQQLKDFEILSGKSVAISPFSNFWGENYVSNRQLNEIASYGAVPLLRMMPWGEPYWKPGYQPEYALQRILDGYFDVFLSSWADEIKAFGKPVMVTFGCEMNGDWFPWSGIFQGGNQTVGFGDPERANGPERYVAAYRHIVELFREKRVENAAWLFQPNSSSHPEEEWNSLSAYYPGDEYVDWVGVSVYGAQFVYESWSSFQVLMDPVYRQLVSLFPNKSLMLAEWGVGEWPDKGDKAAWYKEALDALRTKYTLIRIAIVYHERWPNSDGTWSDLRIDSSPRALDAYRSGIGSHYFIGKSPSFTIL